MLQYIFRSITDNTKHLAFFVLLTALYIFSLLYTGGIVSEGQVDSWLAGGWAVAIVIVSRMIVSLFSDLISQNIWATAKKNLYGQLPKRLPLLQHQYSSSQILHSFTTEFPTFHMLSWSSALDLFSQGLVGFLALGFILTIDSSAALILTASLVLIGLIVIKAKSHIRPIVFKQKQLKAKLFSQEMNTLRSIEQTIVHDNFHNQLDSYQRLITSSRNNEHRLAFLNIFTQSLNWIFRYGVLLILVTPLMQSTSPKLVYWLFIFVGAVNQATWSLQSLIHAHAHWLKCKFLLDDQVTTEPRKLGHDLEVMAKNLAIGFSKDGDYQLQSLSFAWQPGDCVWVKGPSGSGKTTLFRTLLGLHHHWSGEVTMPKREFFTYSYISHDLWLNSDLSLGEVLGIEEIDKSTIELIESLGLAQFFINKDSLKSRLWSSQLKPSKGELNRIFILKELLRKPDILIADEPSVGLDEPTACKVLQTLKSTMKQGIFIFSEHNQQLGASIEANIILNLSTGAYSLSNPKSSEDFVATRPSVEVSALDI